MGACNDHRPLQPSRARTGLGAVCVFIRRGGKGMGRAAPFMPLERARPAASVEVKPPMTRGGAAATEMGRAGLWSTEDTERHRIGRKQKGICLGSARFFCALLCLLWTRNLL